jgi:hypothetical protein
MGNAPGDHPGMSSPDTNPTRWLAGILIGVILTALGGLSGVVLRHEGIIGRWEGQLDTIQRSLERMEQKVDNLLKR